MKIITIIWIGKDGEEIGRTKTGRRIPPKTEKICMITSSEMAMEWPVPRA